MVWLILSCSLVNLVLLVVVARQYAHTEAQVEAIRVSLSRPWSEPDSAPSSTISPLMEPGSSFLPSDQEAAAVESRMLYDSEQRAGSVRSRRSSTRMRG